MKTIYENNIQKLQSLYPEIGDLLEDAKKTVEEDIKIQEFRAENNERGIIVSRGEREFYMYGKRNMFRPIEKWYDGLGQLQNNAPIIMMGVANGLYLETIAERVENHLTIIVYEPSIKIFVDFLSNFDITKWLDKHTIVFWVDGLEGMTRDALSGLINAVLTYEVLPLSRTFVLPNYTEIFEEESLFFIKTCHDVAENSTVHFSTLKTFSGVFAPNLLSNVKWLVDGYKSTQLLKVVPRDIPGIVVAAGPSLNKNVAELRKAKGKAFIIATDTAVKPLIKAGVIPDMFVIVDAMKPLKVVNMEEVKNIPLSTVIDAPIEILEYHTGKKFFANEGLQFVDRILRRYEKQYGRATDGGSVATAAFSLLYRLGISRIILVGQDLAMTGNRSHADGTFEEKMPEVDTSNYIMVKGNVEEEVPTRDDFKLYLKWYENFIQTVQEKEPEFKVINATEGGAFIKGTEVLSLKEAIDRECTKEVDIQKNFDALEPMFGEEDRKWVQEQIENIPSEFKKIMNWAKEAEELYTKVDTICRKRKFDKVGYVKIIKKINAKLKKIEENELYQIIFLTMNEAEYILKNEQFIQYDSEIEEGLEIARQGKIFMKGIHDCAKIYYEYTKDLYKKGN